MSAITIDASAITTGINYNTYIDTYFAAGGDSSYEFYAGTPDSVFGGTYYMNGDQLAYSFADSSNTVILEGNEIAYDWIHYGMSYPHALSGGIDSITFGTWIEGVTTGTQGTGAEGAVTGLEELLVISGLDIDVAAGTGNVEDNAVMTLYNAFGGKDAATIYALLDTYAQHFIGSSAADVYIGTANNDTIDGGTGKDKLTGGAGDDVYYVDDRWDIVNEAVDGGIDTIIATANVNILTTQVENITLTGSADLKANGNSLDNVITGNDGDNVLRASGGNDTVSGGAGNDSLYGAFGNDSLSGDAGDDYLDGGKGNDILSGGAGNDTLVGGTGRDTMVGGDGDDTYYVDHRWDIVTEDADGGTDTIIATANVNILKTQVENITLTGAADLKVTGNDGDNVLRASGGDDLVSGGAGNDSLYGAFGNDTLIGGDDADVLDGGAGSDTFVFNAVSDSSVSAFDSIVSFNARYDTLDVSGLGLTGGFTGSTATANSLWYDADQSLVLADASGDGVADFAVRIDTLVGSLSASAITFAEAA